MPTNMSTTDRFPERSKLRTIAVAVGATFVWLVAALWGADKSRELASETLLENTRNSL